MASLAGRSANEADASSSFAPPVARLASAMASLAGRSANEADAFSSFAPRVARLANTMASLAGRSANVADASSSFAPSVARLASAMASLAGRSANEADASSSFAARGGKQRGSGAILATRFRSLGSALLLQGRPHLWLVFPISPLPACSSAKAHADPSFAPARAKPRSSRASLGSEAASFTQDEMPPGHADPMISWRHTRLGGSSPHVPPPGWGMGGAAAAPPAVTRLEASPQRS